MTIRRLSLSFMCALVAMIAGLSAGSAQATPNVPDPATGFLLNGRQLTPQGAQVALGNFPTGGAVTADGRFLWTVSAGQGANDVRIVDTARRRVRQTIALSGASGGIALDSRHRRAYISAISVSRWWPSQAGLPGAAGNFVSAPSPSPPRPEPRSSRSFRSPRRARRTPGRRSWRSRPTAPACWCR